MIQLTQLRSLTTVNVMDLGNRVLATFVYEDILPLDGVVKLAKTHMVDSPIDTIYVDCVDFIGHSHYVFRFTKENGVLCHKSRSNLFEEWEDHL